MLEGQFRNYFEMAARQRGIVGENLLILLERRLDNVVYRIGFATSRAFARQLVNHGHVLVNGKKVNIPSFQVKVGDIISIKNESASNPQILQSFETAAGRGRPSWIEIGDKNTLSGRVIALPRREDITHQVNEQMIVELYSK
jgi:small subunit ribosomal protein S4